MAISSYADPTGRERSARRPMQDIEPAGRSSLEAEPVAQGVNSGPRLQQQREAVSNISNSPRMVKQGRVLRQRFSPEGTLDRANGSYNSNPVGGRGVVQGFGMLSGLALLSALGAGAYGAYRWWKGRDTPPADASDSDSDDGRSHDSDDDSEYVPNSEDDWDDTAEDRLRRMRERGEARREARGRVPTGRYQTPTGMTTVSGLFGQRMSQARKEDYGGETFGSTPPYAGLQANIPDAAVANLGYPQAAVPTGLTHRQRLAVALTHTLANASEEDRAPGYGSYSRAMARDYARTGGQDSHPLHASVNPARISAEEARDLMAGRTALSDQQRRALEEDSEPSSDSDDDYFLQR